MAKFTLGAPRKNAWRHYRCTMGVNTCAAFAGSDENAVVDGDFGVTENEL